MGRNVRGGKGEKDLSHEMYLSVRKHFPNTSKRSLPLYATRYGYWKDLLLLSEKSKQEQEQKNNDYDNDLLKEAIDLMRVQFRSDLDAVAEYEETANNRKKNNSCGG